MEQGLAQLPGNDPELLLGEELGLLLLAVDQRLHVALLGVFHDDEEADASWLLLWRHFWALHSIVVLVLGGLLWRRFDLAADLALPPVAKILRLVAVEVVIARGVNLPVNETVIQLDDVWVRDLLHHGDLVDDLAVLLGGDPLAQLDLLQGDYSLLSALKHELSSAVDGSVGALAENTVDLEVVKRHTVGL